MAELIIHAASQAPAGWEASKQCDVEHGSPKVSKRKSTKKEESHQFEVKGGWLRPPDHFTFKTSYIYFCFHPGSPTTILYRLVYEPLFFIVNELYF